MQETALEMSFTCIIPLRTDDAWTEESSQRLSPLKKVFDEVLLVGTDIPLKTRLPSNFRRIVTPHSNRAHLMNVGAREAKYDYLSFLYFDSDFDSESFARLRLSLKPQTLYYFDFEFAPSSPLLCGINSWAINLRADSFQLPFGNQCYNLEKKSFFNVGAFSEKVIKDEDAEFIKRWGKKGYATKKAKGVIRASSAEYQQRGWFKTTASKMVWNFKYWIGKEPRELAQV